MNFRYQSPLPKATLVDGYAPGNYNDGNTYYLPRIDGPWQNTGAPMSQQGSWERFYRTWPYWMRTLNGVIPAPEPLPGTDAYIRRNRTNI